MSDESTQTRSSSMGKKQPKTFILVDTMNMFFRSKHFANGQDINEKIGMALHIMFNSLRKQYRLHKGGHVVLCLEGHSWRYDLFPEYKLPRKVKALEKTEAEKEEDTIFLEALGDFTEYMKEKTNASVIQAPNAEADDLIALWCEAHPDDHNIIVSSDQDYVQLISENVSIYDGVTETTITLDGFFDDKNERIEKKGDVNPRWSLFEKCIRGDRSDGIKSSYPGVRKKGTKNKIGMLEAFDDIDDKGYIWNNFMLQRWTDADDNEHTVKERYEFNKHLIDLHDQPEEIKRECLEAIFNATEKEKVKNVGLHFMKFCALWDLKKISDTPDDFAKLLQHPYK